MTSENRTQPDLTKNQALVFGTLTAAHGPLTAYNILDLLRDEGFKAPLQVYRALDKLIEFGIVHRLESMNAFVACQHPNCGANETVIFMICEKCESVAELASDKITGHLAELTNTVSFVPEKSTVELRGRCADCQN